MARRKHRLGQPQPEPAPAQQERQDQLWDAYQAAKKEHGTDNMTTWDRFFEWWVAT